MKDVIIQILDRALDEVEEQYQTANRRHWSNVDALILSLSVSLYLRLSLGLVCVCHCQNYYSVQLRHQLVVSQLAREHILESSRHTQIDAGVNVAHELHICKKSILRRSRGMNDNCSCIVSSCSVHDLLTGFANMKNGFANMKNAHDIQGCAAKRFWHVPCQKKHLEMLPRHVVPVAYFLNSFHHAKGEEEEEEESAKISDEY